MKDKKALLILIPFLLFVIIIGAFAIVGDRIPDNPPETVGNTAGNLNNSGYFCEYDGKVYFANVYDSDTLYSMDLPNRTSKNWGMPPYKISWLAVNSSTIIRLELPGMPGSVRCELCVPSTAVS